MRKIMVCVKRVVDYNVRVRVKPDGRASSPTASR
jgi:electron transfer flavoprotein alpha/beta subunit